MSPPGPVLLLFGIRSVHIKPVQYHSIRVIQVAGVFEKVLEELCSYNSSHCTFWVLGTTVRTSAPNCLNLCWNAGPTKTHIDDLIMPIYIILQARGYIYIHTYIHTYVYIYVTRYNTMIQIVSPYAWNTSVTISKELQGGQCVYVLSLKPTPD